MIGGTGLSDALKKIADQKSIKARVGILDGKTYPDGELVAQVGYWNEYGYTGRVAARTATVYHSVNEKTGEMNKGGRFVKKGKSNFAREVVIPEHEVRIPSRPFFRSAIAKNKKNLGQMIASLIKKHGAEKAVRETCTFMADELNKSVMGWTDPPNAASTIAAKGYNAPLRGNDKLLRNSFSYEIVEND